MSILAVDVIGKRPPHATEHVAGFVLSTMKISAHPLSHAVKRSALVLVAFFVSHFFFTFVSARPLAINAFLGGDILHRRAGKHAFGSADVSAICAYVNRADRLARWSMQGHDPGWIAPFIRAQRVTRAVETRARFVGGV